MNFYNKLKKLQKKGILFYVRIKINKIKRRNTLFGWLFLTFYQYYKIEKVKVDVGKDLYPLSLYSRFFFNIYEHEEVSLLRKYLEGHEKVLELGACIGVVSCVTNSLLKNPHKHVIVEANPDLIPYLEKNKEINNSRFKIVNGVISDKERVEFYTYHSALAGSLEKQIYSQEFIDSCTEHIIDGITPLDLEEKYNLNFDTLIMDIEGGEFELIENYRNWLSNLNMLLIEFHPGVLDSSSELNRYVQILKEDCQFTLTETLGESYVFHKKERIF